MQSYIPQKKDLVSCFSVYFMSCIVKGLTICKFGGVIRAECCAFKLELAKRVHKSTRLRLVETRDLFNLDLNTTRLVNGSDLQTQHDS